ncbi:phage shock protein PspA [Temperatibacter marinus]|uniref:Phage shock protein PspA n=1 Tax=Temperatibacter marinus TaxID=1456591 RepID=A0AA52EGR4_9PROT|nr:phage shock protein PspA [Temperatibacter marinus]WND03358.1 phage shock protein PspA [Temperatibacter marinus]
MGIFSRLSDIINSNINAILDRAEDPDKIIRMVIQEMEDTLVEVRSSAARAIADQKDIERKLVRIEEASSEWETKAELAISKGREDLAKGALMEKNKLTEMADHLKGEIAHIQEALTRHEEDVVKLDKKLREARAKKASLKTRTKTAQNTVKLKRNIYDTRIDDAFERFDKVERRLDRIEGEAEAMEMGREGKSLEQEFADLETTDEVEAELEALKAKVNGTKKSEKKETEAAE